jgi:hypothetical protein
VAVIVLGDYLHDVILMDWHPERELFAAYNGTEENVNVTLWAVVFVNLWIVEGDLSNVLDTFVLEDHVVIVFKGVQEGAEGGVCLSHESILAEVSGNASFIFSFFSLFSPAPWRF